MEKYYRVYSKLNSYGTPTLQVDTFYVIKKTEKGAWISCDKFGCRDVLNGTIPWKSAKEELWDLHWVSNSSKKRYAYPALSGAVLSFYRRKLQHVRYARIALQRAQAALNLAEHYVYGNGEVDEVLVEDALKRREINIV